MPTSTTAARTFLKMNAVFSLLTAVPLLLAAGTVASVLFADPADWAAWGLRGLGLGLIGFAGLVYAISTYKFVSRAMVNEIVVLDVLWVIGSIVLIAVFGHILSTSGTVIVAAAAVVVAFFAVSQFVSAARIKKPIPVATVEMREGKLRATVKRTVRAPTETVWDVMTDHPAYADDLEREDGATSKADQEIRDVSPPGACPHVVDLKAQVIVLGVCKNVLALLENVGRVALGARGTMIGRAFVYGLGAMGEAGVTKVLQVIHKELDTTMALCGERNVVSLGPHNLLMPRDFANRWVSCGAE